MFPTKIITLNHYLRGPMRVRRYWDANFFTGARMWKNTDAPDDAAPLYDWEFKEPREQIDAQLAPDDDPVGAHEREPTFEDGHFGNRPWR